MCGIVAVLARPSVRQPPKPSEVEAALSRALAALQVIASANDLAARGRDLAELAADLERLNDDFRGVPGVSCLLSDPRLPEELERDASHLEELVGSLEAALDAGLITVSPSQLESLNASLVRLRDAVWGLRHDRLAAATSISGLSSTLGLSPDGTVPGAAALRVLWAVHVAFRSLDRLEVRGRDSAGLHLMLAGDGLDLASPEVAALLAARANDPLFTSYAVRTSGGCLSLVYKAAAEIGELGDNVAALRHALSSDPLLARALASTDVRATVVGHTRWASVGLISQANAHPLNSEEIGASGGPYVIGALNGDVDNYAELSVSEGLRLPDEVTTDAKLVPTLVSRYLAAGEPMGEAFRRAVGRFEGSVGIAVNGVPQPDEIYLALRGSGQGLNIGLAEDAFVVASEAYGLVEEARRYLRMDGEGGGQVVVCSRDGAGTLAGLARRRYDGVELAVGEQDLIVAEITTRDVDRRGFRHFLLKEISESPLSVRKTLRGKIFAGENGQLSARLGDDVITPALRAALVSGKVHDVIVVGQGTAAVAGQAVAAAISSALPSVAVKAMPATELSGWGLAGSGLPDDMSGSLVVAISQSGTTTDTNRTVDLVRARGAHVVAIVNRRNSDLVQKAHGVLYTSDGRDVEMSVASTKAFYSQVAAGHLLALGWALQPAQAGGRVTARRDPWQRFASCPRSWKRSSPDGRRWRGLPRTWRRRAGRWAVVGSGPDHVAAAEIRIKLSELCYKAIALDVGRGQKAHRPFGRATGHCLRRPASGPNAHDIAKEVEIFRAHKAAPVRDRGRRRKRTLQPERRRVRRAGLPPGAGLRPGGHGRPHLRLRGRPVDRRPGTPSARSPCRPRGRAGRGHRVPSTSWRRPSRSAVAPALAGLALAVPTTATSMLRPPPGSRPCCATRPGRCPWRATRPRWARSVLRRHSRLTSWPLWALP